MTVSCGTRLNSTCTSQSADVSCETPVPVYPSGPTNAAQPCQENHCLEIQTNLYGAALEVGLQFNIPACGQPAVVYIPGLTLAHVGSYLWSSIYGYYEITAYNSFTNEVTIQNNCTNGNSAGGTTVPKCSTFVVTSAPINANDDIAYLAADFVTPALTLCTAISVTSTEGLLAGNTVSIGSGTYTVSTIIDDDSMIICNNGLGQTPGSTVTALSGSGGYNYPIVIENDSSVLEDQDEVLAVPLSSGTTSQTVTASISYTNVSTDKNAQMFYSAIAYLTGTTLNAHTAPVSFRMNLEVSIDGGAFASVNDQSSSQYDLTDAAHDISKELSYDGVQVIAPLATRTVDVRITATWLGTGTALINIDALVSTLEAIIAF